MGETTPVMPTPRIVRPAPDPLGFYLRPGRKDHKLLTDLMAGGNLPLFGMVFDPTATVMAWHRELREKVGERKGEVVLDPKTQQSALQGRITKELGELAWGVKGLHKYADFQGAAQAARIAAIGNFAVTEKFTAVLAPTHLLKSVDDSWLPIDLDSARNLRAYLDSHGGEKVALFYSLAIPYAAFRNADQRGMLLAQLKGLPVSAIWLKVENVGATCTAAALRNYIEAAADFHRLGIPLVADHMGGIPGLALLAFGAVGGIAHGVTLGETFDATAWRKPPGDKKFGPQHRVYLAAMDMMLKTKEANELFEASSRARTLLGCKDTGCCPHGVTDMVQQAGRHFLNQRTAALATLSQIPQAQRAQEFLNRFVLPVTDVAFQAAKPRWRNKELGEKVTKNRKRLDSIRIVLGKMVTDGLPRSLSQLPKTRVARG